MLILNFCPWLKKVLEAEKFKPPEKRLLDEKDIDELILDTDETRDETVRKDIFGYPSRPLYRDIGQRLNDWMETKFCPLEQLPKYDLLDERDYILHRQNIIDLITPKLERLRSLHCHFSNDEILFYVREIIELLGKRGLLDMLGMRKTVGSVDHWPPPKRTLITIFCQKQNPDSASELTVGGRAFTKHSHRDRSSTWWGVCTGSEQAKNDYALKKMMEILDEATWLNIHELPGGSPTIEARQKNGYGVRWTDTGNEFRGFLEPQMVGGHDVGWVH